MDISCESIFKQLSFIFLTVENDFSARNSVIGISSVVSLCQYFNIITQTQFT